MTEVVAPIHGRRLDGRFALLEKLGSGGQGEVWRAHDDTRGIDIALKVPASAEAPDQSVLAAFEREHAIAARLDHPSVLKVFPPHRSGELVVLPMELATGGDLRRLRGAGYLDIIPVLLDIAQALEHAHERGVIHRDLKPGNVLFDARGRVKLADFGAAGTTSTTAADARLQGLSPFTASPEQLRGEAPTESDDIYGLGALAYELLSGYPPYYPHFDLRRAQEDPVPNLVPTRQIPPLLTALVMRMLAKNRNERPRSMREVIDELDTALNDTLAFDFESIVDPTHGAPSAAVLVGPPPAARSTPAAAGKTEQRSPAPPKTEFREPARGGAARDAGARDGVRGGAARDDSEDDEDDDGPDLGLIPDLLVANALVVTPAGKGARSAGPAPEARVSTPSQAGTLPSTAAPATKSASTQVLKSTSTPSTTAAAAGSVPTSTPASASKGPATSAAEASSSQPRKSDGQTVNNDTIYLPPDPESPVRGAEGAATPRGVGAAWRVSNAQSINNDTMQLPPEPAPTRGLGAAWRVATARSVAAAGSASYDHAANEQSIRPQVAPAAASASAPAPGTVPSPPPSASSQASSNWAAASNPAASHPATANPVAANPPGTRNSAVRPNPAVPSESVTPNLTVLRRTPAQHGSPAVVGPSADAGARDAPGFRGAVGDGQAVSSGGAFGGGGAASGATFGNAGGAIPGEPTFSEERPLWESLKLDTVPRVARLEPIRRRHWPIVLLGILAGIAVAVFYWLPRYTTQGLPFDLSDALSRATKNLTPSPTSTSDSTTVEATPDTTSGTTTGQTTGASDSQAATNSAAAPQSAEAKLQSARDNFDRRLAALETRGAGVWGGPEFGLAKMRAAESVGAHDAGNTRIAQERLADASHLLDQVESKAPQALAAQLAVGEKALAAGQEELANQAFDLARRIDPNDKRIAEDQRHTHNLNGVLPLLADGQNAENARNFSRAAQDYSQALSIDPGNDKARAGLARANAAFGDDNYAKAVGSGFAALGAGRLDDARDAFEKARALRPNGSEAAEGLRRVGAALSAKGFASLRQKAAGLEAQERWDEAVQAYDSALQADPSLAFAQEGKDRAAARAELNASMQALIDRPERFSSQSLRDQGKALLDTANRQSPSGPVLRSQITRLGMLLPDYDGTVRSGSARTDLLDKPIRLSLVSDNATAVAIPSIGQFGTFAKRDIQLKPGRYTVIGTRDGFRDVRRDITIAPGQESQTISVSCSDPI